MDEFKAFEIIEKAKQYKVEGNEFFGKDLFEFATKKYQKALRWIDYIKDDQEDVKRERDKMKVDVFNNVSLLMMKQEEYDEVIKYAQKVLEIDGKNIKALSRCGHAKIKQKKYAEAKDDLKRAKSINGNNSYVKKLYNIAVNKVKQEKKKQQQQYKSMFGYRPEKTSK